MLKIEINNTVIPYYPNISLPIVENSPFFTDSAGKIPGDYIFNTKFPASAPLKYVFSFAHKISRAGRATAELPYTITQGVIRYSATCIIEEANEKEFEIAFKYNKGEFAAIIKNKILKDLNFGDDKNISDAFAIVAKDEVYRVEKFYDSENFEYDHFDIELPALIDVAYNYNAYSPWGFVAYKPGNYHFSLNLQLEVFCISLGLEILRSDGSEIWIPINIDLDQIMYKTSVKYEMDLYMEAWDWIKVRVQIQSKHASFYNGQFGNFNYYVFSILRGGIEFSLPNIFDSNISKNQDTTDFAIFPFKNSKLLDNFPDDGFMIDNTSIKVLYTEYFEILNYYNGRFPALMSREVDDELFVAANLFIPFVYMTHLLSKIVSDAGYTLENNPFETDDFREMVLMNQYAENFFSNQFVSILPYKNTFNLKDHVPSLAQNEFFRFVCSLTGYFPNIDTNLKKVSFVSIKNRHILTSDNSQNFDGIILENKTIKIKPEFNGYKLEIVKASQDGYLDRIKDIPDKINYRGEVEHINNLPGSGNSPGDMFLVTNLNEYYVYQYNPNIYSLAWSFYSKNWPLIHTSGTEDFYSISTGISPVLTSSIEDKLSESRILKVPVMETPGNIEGFPDSFADEWGLQVAYYRGTRNDSNGNSYPLGTCRKEDYENESFVNINAKDLFNEQYKDFVEYIVNNAKPVTLKALITPLQLKNMDITKIQITPYFNFLVKQKRHALLADNITIVEMDVYVV